MGYFNDHVGLRGDVRYMRSVGSNFPSTFDVNGDLHFWRLSFGVLIR